MVQTRAWRSLLCSLSFMAALALTQGACSDEGGSPPGAHPGNTLPVDQILPKNPLRITESDFTVQADGTRQAVIEIPYLGSDQALTLIALNSTQLDHYEPDPSQQEKLLSFELITTGLETPPAPPLSTNSQGLTGMPLHPSPDSHLSILNDGPKTLSAEHALRIQNYSAGKVLLPTPFGKCQAPYVVGQTQCTFEIIINDLDQAPRTAVLRHISERALFFVDEANTNDFNSSDWAILSETYDQKLPLLENYFGPMPDTDQNGKVIIVLSSQLSKKGVNGYVAPWDLVPEDLFPIHWVSNQGEIVYANTPSGVAPWGWTKENYLARLIRQTLLHESKHILSTWHRLQKGQTHEAPWIEEPSAFAALELIGLGMPTYTTQKSFANLALEAPHHYRMLYEYYPQDIYELRAMYGFNMLFLWKIAERVGHDHFWMDLVSNEKKGLDSLQEVAKATYPGGFSEMLEEWALTLRFDGDTANPGFESYHYAKPELNLRDGTWAKLGVRSMGNLDHTASFNRRFYALSVGFLEGRGKNTSATLRIVLDEPQIRPHFLLVAHSPLDDSNPQ